MILKFIFDFKFGFVGQGLCPWTPAKELFEKSSLESQKLSKMFIYQYIFESS